MALGESLDMSSFGGTGGMKLDFNFDKSFAESWEKERKKALKDAEKKRQAALAQKKLEAEAAEFTKLGAMSEEQIDYMNKLKAKSEGENLVTQALAARAQERAQRQLMAQAYARGYDPGAQRAAMRQASEVQTDIATQAMAAGEQEKSQAMAAYGQMLQYQQQMAFSAEQARKAYLMGNKELAQQYDLERQRIKAGLEGAKLQYSAAQDAAAAQKEAAWIGAGATVLSALIPGGK